MSKCAWCGAGGARAICVDLVKRRDDADASDVHAVARPKVAVPVGRVEELDVLGVLITCTE